MPVLSGTDPMLTHLLSFHALRPVCKISVNPADHTTVHKNYKKKELTITLAFKAPPGIHFIN